MQDDDDMPSPRRFRLIPLTMIMLSLLLVIKVNELYIGSQKLREIYSVRDAHAEDAKTGNEATPAADAAKPVDSKAATKDAKAPDATASDKAAAESKDAKAPDAVAGDKKDAAAGDVKPADGATKDAGDKKDAGGDKKDGEKKEGEKKPDEPRTYGTGKSTLKQIEALKQKQNAPQYSQTEVDLLENLAKRRAELDQREKDLDMKAQVLGATQKRIDDKIAEMKTVEAQLAKVVAQYNEKQNAQIASLVKIYENMKPLNAAAIFNELDMPILLEVVDKMSERKVSPILALMDPKRARDVTQELAEMRKSAGKADPTKPAGTKQ